ncbi:uncharacterized protein LOC130589986 [Beta vulgaris subsp. vulgaris]|uniref:uncharacterized protein LOC130589986 n=1 Tax=Beta vulgaris subsp. vulgaris TaxID=3555 RepID=UPI0025486B03|nr:uncharacterized protein LOC130589986 [Beta vulgaris subsp. vulgaris]
MAMRITKFVEVMGRGLNTVGKVSGNGSGGIGEQVGGSGSGGIGIGEQVGGSGGIGEVVGGSGSGGTGEQVGGSGGIGEVVGGSGSGGEQQGVGLVGERVGNNVDHIINKNEDEDEDGGNGIGGLGENNVDGGGGDKLIEDEDGRSRKQRKTKWSIKRIEGYKETWRPWQYKQHKAKLGRFVRDNYRSALKTTEMIKCD